MATEEYTDIDFSEEILGQLTKREMPFNTAQMELVNKVRDNLKTQIENLKQHPPVVSDLNIMRFLSGEKFSVIAATHWMANMLDWRHVNKVDEIRNGIIAKIPDDDGVKFPLKASDIPLATEVQSLLSANYYHKLTKSNSPVQMQRPATQNYSRMLVEVGEHSLLGFFVHMFEFRQMLLDRLSIQHNRIIKLFMLIDMDGFGRKNVDRVGMSPLS